MPFRTGVKYSCFCFILGSSGWVWSLNFSFCLGFVVVFFLKVNWDFSGLEKRQDEGVYDKCFETVEMPHDTKPGRISHSTRELREEVRAVPLPAVDHELVESEVRHRHLRNAGRASTFKQVPSSIDMKRMGQGHMIHDTADMDAEGM